MHNSILPQITELNGYGKLSETGWTLEPKNLDDWRNHINAFLHADGRYKSARQWCLGDAFNALKWGDRKAECDRLGLNYQTVSNYCNIASAFNFTSRCKSLSFNYHQLAAPIKDKNVRDSMLKTAEKNKLTLQQFKESIAEYNVSQLPDNSTSEQVHAAIGDTVITEDIRPEGEVDELSAGQEDIMESVVFDNEPMPAWTDEELKIWDELCAGRSVAVNRHLHVNVIEKASRQKKTLYVGRGGFKIGWGNPFELGVDGTRDEVCDLYEQYFWLKKSLYDNIEKLKGKLLICSCKPERCHADFLAKLANGEI